MQRLIYFRFSTSVMCNLSNQIDFSLCCHLLTMKIQVLFCPVSVKLVGCAKETADCKVLSAIQSRLNQVFNTLIKWAKIDYM